MKSGLSHKEGASIINLKGVDNRMKSAPGNKRGIMSAAYKKGIRGEETMDIADEIYEDEESSGDDL
jgi:hypothetical protein